MKTIKVSEATGTTLDWLVAKCEGWKYDDKKKLEEFQMQQLSSAKHCYSSVWAKGGPIIEREGIKVAPTVTRSAWMAQIRHTEAHPLVDHPVFAGWTNQNGPTPLIAAMRAFVASKLGETVEVLEELT